MLLSDKYYWRETILQLVFPSFVPWLGVVWLRCILKNILHREGTLWENRKLLLKYKIDFFGESLAFIIPLNIEFFIHSRAPKGMVNLWIQMQSSGKMIDDHRSMVNNVCELLFLYTVILILSRWEFMASVIALRFLHKSLVYDDSPLLTR